MLHLIGPHNQHRYLHQLASMHRLRKRIFKDQLKWSSEHIKIISGMEFDQFDLPHAHYLVRVNDSGEVDACTRLLPTSGPYLLGDIYPQLIEKISRPDAGNIWETSRFCADPSTAPKEIVGILVAGMVKFGLERGIRNFVSVSDIRIEFLLRKSGWPPERLGGTVHTGTDTAAAERFEVSNQILCEVCRRADIQPNFVISNLEDLDVNQMVAA